MEEIQHIAKNQPDWQENVNAAINYLNGGRSTIGSGVIDDVMTKLGATNWSTDGIVLLNGTTWNKNSLGYCYVQLNGFKLVAMDIKITGHTSRSGGTVAKIPDFIAPTNKIVTLGFSGWASTGALDYRSSISNNVIEMSTIGSSPSGDWTAEVNGYVTYLHFD